jgi:hypothetical protein
VKYIKGKEQKPIGYVEKKKRTWINNKIKQIIRMRQKFLKPSFFKKQQLVLPIFCKDERL